MGFEGAEYRLLGLNALLWNNGSHLGLDISISGIRKLAWRRPNIRLQKKICICFAFPKDLQRNQGLEVFATCKEPALRRRSRWMCYRFQFGNQWAETSHLALASEQVHDGGFLFDDSDLDHNRWSWSKCPHPGHQGEEHNQVYEPFCSDYRWRCSAQRIRLNRRQLLRRSNRSWSEATWHWSHAI